MLKYKGYTGSFVYDGDEEILFGRVIDVDAVITFFGSSIEEMKQAFKDSVNTYLETCEKKSIFPKKTFSGNIRLRVTPEIHQKSYIAANTSGKSLNRFIQEALLHEIEA